MDQTLLSPQQRLVRSLILLICLATMLLTSLRVIGHGFFPGDDALRHVAKVIYGKPWSEILVVRPEITMDSHPGWHVILSGFQSLTGIDKKGLLNSSVILLFLAFTLPPVFYFRRGEAWVASLALSTIFFFGPIMRLFFGRPYIVSMVMVLLFCFLWDKIRDKKRPWIELVILIFVSALATWIHGTWYLFTLPLLSLVLARQWRVFALMSGAMAFGVILGAVFTGSPIAFLHQMFFHALEAFGKYDFNFQLVSEFQPFTGEVLVFLLVGGLLVWRLARDEWNNSVVDNPIFYLVIIGWSMGFFASRFWTDWAWPALAFWIALEIQIVLEHYTDRFSLKRLALTGMFCIILLLSVTNDYGSRWSGITAEWPNITKTAHRPWLPDEGGILYNDNMFLFYQVFYLNPHAPWRYTLGFEPIWMPADNLEIFRRIQLARGKDETYIPWVKKMNSKDRLMLIRNAKPKIEGLEWHEVTPTVWSGRIPRNILLLVK
jgi:hypothetical protein